MGKKYKVKHYYGGKSGGFFKANPHPLGILAIVLSFAALVYVGTIIYEPIYDFVMNIGKPAEIVYTEPEIPEPAESEPPAEPEPKPEPEYDKLRAVYLPFETASDNARLDAFLSELSGTEINAVMIDIKNADGDVLYKTGNEMAGKWGVTVSNAIDLKAFSSKLEQKNLYLAVKMSVFRDPRAASAGRLDYAINYQNTDYLWLDAAPDNGGKPWLNPYSQLTQDYLESLALEAADAGAKMIVLENVRFPDNSGVYATFGKSPVTMGRSEILRAFVEYLTGRAEEKNARIAVYYPVTEQSGDQEQANRYGGSPLKIPVKHMLLGAQPSQFGGDYSEGGLEIAQPLQDPAGAVKASVNYTKRGVSPDAAMIPMLQGGNDAPFNNAQSYTVSQVKAQIEAARELGLDEYVLYNSNGEYLLK